MTWREAVAHALAHPGAERATQWGQPELKVNGDAVLNVGNEPDTSFALHLDAALIAKLMTTHPDTFWKSAHHAGHTVVLVRHHGPDGTLARDMVARACAQAAARRPARSRAGPASRRGAVQKRLKPKGAGPAA